MKNHRFVLKLSNDIRFIVFHLTCLGIFLHFFVTCFWCSTLSIIIRNLICRARCRENKALLPEFLNWGCERFARVVRECQRHVIEKEYKDK